MKTLKLLFSILISSILLSSCYTTVVEEPIYHHNSEVVVVNQPTLEEIVTSHELWYVDIHRTLGSGEVPFMQIAFTLSFRNGRLYANNNLVGIGSQGNGFGIPIGYYDTSFGILDIDHDIDGFVPLEVRVINNFEISVYDSYTNTTYFLEGYNRNNFDYDRIFYENTHYFMQEYVAWEKVYTSNYGALNDFDHENFLQFIAGGSNVDFRSSQDEQGSNINNLLWDFTGIYDVYDVQGIDNVKELTLSYDYFGDDYFELTILDDRTLEFFHVASGTLYRFKGRGYIEFMKGKTKRKKRTKIDKKFRK